MPDSTPTPQNLARHYQAPSESGEVLAVPSLTEAVAAAERNKVALDRDGSLINGERLTDLRRAARAEIISRAVEWTNRMTGQESACAECSHHAALLFVTGHQPQLAHAGVWAKNFAAAGLAKRGHGIGLNIIVDNDTVGTQAIQVPTGTRDEVRYENVSFDSAQPQQPWEELKIQDRDLFESFGERVREAMQPWGIDPLITEMWSTATETSRHSDSVVECLAACRILQERSWGNTNLELPLSEICQTEAFLTFLTHVILNAKEFQKIYNNIVSFYRQENGIRNDRHPVPDLLVTDEGFELPFWFWNENDIERGQVFCRPMDDLIQLISKGRVILESKPDQLKSELRKLQGRGKLRTRALTTTLFSRLFLADLFIHGIGGAKYDEMTDLLIKEFYNIEPPEFLVLSATLQLPVQKSEVTEESVADLKAKLRDHHYNAERYISGPEVEELRTRKQLLIEEYWNAQTQGLPKRERVKLRRSNRLRHFELKQVNEELRKLARPHIAIIQAELEEATKRLKANLILKSREFSAAILPETKVHQLVSHLMSCTDEVQTTKKASEKVFQTV